MIISLIKPSVGCCAARQVCCENALSRPRAITSTGVQFVQQGPAIVTPMFNPGIKFVCSGRPIVEVPPVNDVEGPTSLTANAGSCGTGTPGLQPVSARISDVPEPPAQRFEGGPQRGVTTVTVSTDASKGLIVLGALVALGFILLR